MSKRPSCKSVRGFTLIELMVSVLLIGLMGMLLMTSINSSVSAKETVEEISDRYHLASQAMSRMAREISMAYLSKHVNLSSTAYYTQFKGSSDRLFFSAFGNVIRQRDAKESDQQVVGYYLASDRNGDRVLMRRQQPRLNLDVEKGGRAQVLCPHVTSLEFSYFDEESGLWTERWISDPSSMVAAGQLEITTGTEQRQSPGPSPQLWRLPKLVKISMTVDMGQGQEMNFMTKTEIPMRNPLDLQ